MFITSPIFSLFEMESYTKPFITGESPVKYKHKFIMCLCDLYKERTCYTCMIKEDNTGNYDFIDDDDYDNVDNYDEDDFNLF